MQRYIVEVNMNTRIGVKLSIEAEEQELDKAVLEVKEGLEKEGATDVEVVSVEPVIEVSRAAVEGEARVLN